MFLTVLVIIYRGHPRRVQPRIYNAQAQAQAPATGAITPSLPALHCMHIIHEWSHTSTVLRGPLRQA